MKLRIPPEPIELKALMRTLADEQPSSVGKKKAEASIIWTGNKLPKHFWDSWKDELKKVGLNWQSFMTHLKQRPDAAVSWYTGKITWREFVGAVENLINEQTENSLAEDETINLFASNDITQFQHPRPVDWSTFEVMCSSLWRLVCKDPDMQRYGRRGQAQNGIDIYSPLKKVGVQCKKKDVNTVGSGLTEKELKEIVKEAKNFEHPLDKLIVAHTGPNDVKLKNLAIQISTEHKTVGSFEVRVYSWDDIIEAGNDYLDFKETFFPNHLNISPRELAKQLGSIKVQITEGFSEMKNLGTVAQNQVTTVINNAITDVATNSGDDLHIQIDIARDLLNEGKPKEALEFLKKLELKIWHKCGNFHKFRILTNKAAALSALTLESQGALLFVEAFQYNPDDEKALCNRALGHFILGQNGEAKEFAEKAIVKNPLSGRAYSILAQCLANDLDVGEIIQKIPASIRKNVDPAFAIAHIAQQQGDFETSVKWYSDILENSDDKENPEILANLGSALLQSVVGNSSIPNGMPLTSENRKKIEQAIQALTKAIDLVSDSVTLKYRTPWLVNRSTAYKLIEELKLAQEDIEYALKLQPKNPLIIKQSAFLKFSNGDPDSAVEILGKILDNPEVPEASLVLAEILCEGKKFEDAKEILNRPRSNAVPEDIQVEESRLLAQINAQLPIPDFEAARQLVEKLRSADSTNVFNLILSGKIEKKAGNSEAALAIFNEALTYMGKDANPRDIMELADEFFRLEKYSEAWQLYEQIVELYPTNKIKKNLIYSYYRAGEYKKAFVQLESIPDKDKNNFIIQIEAAILEDVGDLKSAARSTEQYLKNNPADLDTRIRLAAMWLRMQQYDELDSFLLEDIDVSKLSIEAAFVLSEIYTVREKFYLSLKLAYDIRRLHFGNGEAHLKYVGLIFNRGDELDDLLSPPKEANAGVAVKLKDVVSGQESWYVIENQPEEKLVKGEISTETEMGKKLLGKKVGEEVILAEDSLSPVRIRILELKSPYIHAFQESLELLPTQFAHTQGIQRFDVGEQTEAETKEGIKKILEIVSLKNEAVMQAEKFYRETKLTVGAFAALVGTSVVDVWTGLANSEWGIKMCEGTLIERQDALSILEGQDKIAVDVTALLTIGRLELFVLFENSSKKLLITQSTLDLLFKEIANKKGIQKKGFSRIAKKGDHFINIEVTPEVVEKEINFLEELYNWAQKWCVKTPCVGISKVEKRRELEKVLDTSFLETIVVASEQNCPLYTDDFGTQALARNSDFGVRSVWTQVLLIEAFSKGLITEDRYNRALVGLISLKYRHVTISGATLSWAAKEAGWKNIHPFGLVLETLRGAQMDLISTISVAVEFLFSLWRQPILDTQRDLMIMAVLDTVTDTKDASVVLRKLRLVLKTRFTILPIAEERVNQVIDAWELLKGIPTKYK